MAEADAPDLALDQLERPQDTQVEAEPDESPSTPKEGNSP